MSEIVEVPIGSDLHLIVESPSIDGVLYDVQNGNWQIEIYASNNKSVIVKKTNGQSFESLGEIYANAATAENKINLYIKSSEVPFSRGRLKGQMTIFSYNENFKDEIQVIKTLECQIGIKIV